MKPPECAARTWRPASSECPEGCTCPAQSRPHDRFPSAACKPAWSPCLALRPAAETCSQSTKAHWRAAPANRSAPRWSAVPAHGFPLHAARCDKGFRHAQSCPCSRCAIQCASSRGAAAADQSHAPAMRHGCCCVRSAPANPAGYAPVLREYRPPHWRYRAPAFPAPAMLRSARPATPW